MARSFFNNTRTFGSITLINYFINVKNNFKDLAFLLVHQEAKNEFEKLKNDRTLNKNDRTLKMTEPLDEKLVYFTVVTPKDLDYKPMENEFVELFGQIPTFIRVCDVCSNEVSLTEKDLDRSVQKKVVICLLMCVKTVKKRIFQTNVLFILDVTIPMFKFEEIITNEFFSELREKKTLKSCTIRWSFECLDKPFSDTISKQIDWHQF